MKQMKSARLQARSVEENVEEKISEKQNESLVTNEDENKSIAKGGVACPFPWRLHDMLEAAEEESLTDIVSWQPHGRSFIVYKPKEFVNKIMVRFFSQTKYASFQRQLNLYGFHRLTHGQDKGAYFHFCFVRGKRSLVRGMVRRKIKGTRVRRALSETEEPNFYDPKWEKYEGSPMTLMDCALDGVETEKFVSATLEQPSSTEESPISAIPPNPISFLDNEISPLVPKPSDQENTSWDASDGKLTNEGDLIFFEGSSFHYLENLMDDPLSDPTVEAKSRTGNDSSIHMMFAV